jgi:hypothetical protein
VRNRRERKTMTRLFAAWNKPAVSILLFWLFVGLCTLLLNRPLSAENKYMKEMGVSVGETSVPSDEDIEPSDQEIEPSDQNVEPSDQNVEPSDQNVEPSDEDVE